jgi:hypothetical protein
MLLVIDVLPKYCNIVGWVLVINNDSCNVVFTRKGRGEVVVGAVRSELTRYGSCTELCKSWGIISLVRDCSVAIVLIKIMELWLTISDNNINMISWTSYETLASDPVVIASRFVPCVASNTPRIMWVLFVYSPYAYSSPPYFTQGCQPSFVIEIRCLLRLKQTQILLL